MGLSPRVSASSPFPHAQISHTSKCEHHMGHELLRALWCLVSFMTNFTWLLEADQPHQHCRSDHWFPPLLGGHSVYVRGACAIHVWPEELCRTAGGSAGRLHTHVQPWPLLSELLGDEHNCYEEIPGKLEPFQAKRRMSHFLTASSHSSPGHSVVTTQPTASTVRLPS